MKNNINDIDLSLFCEYSINPIIITKASFEGPNNPEILYVNPALEKMSGYSADEVVGQTPKIFQGEKSNRIVLSELRSNLEAGKPFEGFTVNYRKDGSEYFIECNISLVRNKDGEVKYFFGVQKDLTDSMKHIDYLKNKIKSIEDDRDNQKQKVIESAKAAAIGEMIDSIAHQWKTPLTVVKGNIELLDMEFDDRETLDRIEKFQDNTINQINHLMDTLNEFRSFLRPSKKTEVFNVSDVIKSSLILLQDVCKTSKIRVEKVLDVDFEINGYPNELKHVFMNMISNSKDAFILNNIKDRNVKIGLTEDDDKVVIFYTDNAGGIPDENLPKIFDRHFTTKENTGGTGIGLNMSKQIIEKMNGKIYADNLDEGVCFIIEFKKS